jgi:hypothetical protein
MEVVASQANPIWKPETDIPPDKRSMFTPLYGLTKRLGKNFIKNYTVDSYPLTTVN